MKQVISKKIKKSKTARRALPYFVAVALVVLGWFIWIGTGKYELDGEIAVCDSSEGQVAQYVTSSEDLWPVYVDETGKRISCGLAGSDNVYCDDFLGSLSDCTIVYRHYEEKEESDLFLSEYTKQIERVFKTMLE